MTGLVMRPRVFPPRDGELNDTFESCHGTRHSAYKYAHGGAPPHFPPPAIPIRVGFMPAHHTQIYPSAYWYVASYRLLWSFFKEFGLVIEF